MGLVIQNPVDISFQRFRKENELCQNRKNLHHLCWKEPTPLKLVCLRWYQDSTLTQPNITAMNLVVHLSGLEISYGPLQYTHKLGHSTNELNPPKYPLISTLPVTPAHLLTLPQSDLFSNSPDIPKLNLGLSKLQGVTHSNPGISTIPQSPSTTHPLPVGRKFYSK